MGKNMKSNTKRNLDKFRNKSYKEYVTQLYNRLKYEEDNFYCTYEIPFLYINSKTKKQLWKSKKLPNFKSEIQRAIKRYYDIKFEYMTHRLKSISLINYKIQCIKYIKLRTISK